jgi:hypothetical protein
MPRKGQPRDFRLDCPAVIEFRNIVHLQLNYLQREYVAENVSCCEKGLRIWRAALTEWMLHGFNPKNVPGVVKLWTTQFFNNPEQRFTKWEPNGNDNHSN